MRITEKDFKSEYILRALKEDENVKTFSCGDEALDDFILNESSVYTKAMLSSTHVVINKHTLQVAAYFSLAKG